MKTIQFLFAFLFLILFVCFMNCSKDKLEDDMDTPEICVPGLNTPLDSAELDNGCMDGSDPVHWSFDWEECENSDYNLVVGRAGDTIPFIDERVSNSEYVYHDSSIYIAETNRSGWKWKVRALFEGKEGEWSGERAFRVEPPDRDCEKNEGLFTDPRDGNVYKTVQIGDQIWMAENLRSVIFPDGSPIPLVEDEEQWKQQHSSAAFCWYDNNSAYQYSYGALYNFSAVMNGEESSDLNPSGVQGVCPSGWHVPSDEEWKELEMYLGMSPGEADNLSWRGTNEGSKIGGQADLWSNAGELTEDPEFGTSHFQAVPAGYRNPDYAISDFAELGSGTAWWSATDSYAREIKLHNSRIYRNSFDRRHGFSVRCVRD